VHRGDNADEEIEADAIAMLQAGGDRFRPDTRDPHVSLRIVDELKVHVVRELAVDADRLQLVKDSFT